jgi:hypothetical protein
MNRTRLVDAIACAFDIVNVACDLIGKDNKKGGYLYVTDQSSQLVTLTLTGLVSDEKKQLAIEKAIRLEAHRNNYSSWQSRNPKYEKRGGAIKSVRYIFSFSGLPEEWDEACMLVLAHEIGELNDAEFDFISKISQNPFAATLKERVAEISL